MKLSDRDIVQHLKVGKIVIEPQPGPDKIKGISVDLRLDNRFRVFNDHTAPYIDLSGPKDEVQKIMDTVMGNEILIADDQSFFTPR
jgi:dCTP deaminase